MKKLEGKPPMVNPISKNIYGAIGMYHWQCPNTMCNGFNKWQTRETVGYVTINCQHCKHIISLNKY